MPRPQGESARYYNIQTKQTVEYVQSCYAEYRKLDKAVLAQHGDFLRCDARSLQWGARQPLLEAEIFRLKPDIIGLQGACPRAPKTENGVMQAAAEGRARDTETRQRDARGEAHGKACRLLR